MKRLIAFISILMLVSSAYGTATSVTIYGTNKSNAQSNITCHGCNNTISVQAWNTSYVKNISVNSLNASGDAVSFNISNVTAYQVQELKVNGTVINAYQAGANGMLNFTYTVVGNRTLVLSPASRAMGYNFTWGYFETLKGIGGTLDISGNIQVENDNPIMTKNAAGGIFQGYNPSYNDNNTYLSTQNNMYFRTGGTSYNIKMTLLEGGNVGIGRNPATELDVAGTINATDLRGNGSGLFGLNASNVTGLPLKNQRNNASLERGVNTVYENTNKTARFVSVRISTNGVAGSLTFYADAANPPTTSVSYLDTGADNYANTFAVLVLPNHYYSITQTGSPAITIRSWSEWT